MAGPKAADLKTGRAGVWLLTNSAPPFIAAQVQNILHVA